MSHIEILMLALALSVDACVVSFSYGILPLKNPIRDKFLLAIFTGIFQALMPVMGYFLVGFAYSLVSPYSKIIVCIIFSALGIKFISEAFKKKRNRELCISLACLFAIGIGTSIDAFSGGISLKLSGNDILYPAIVIGAITYINSILGFNIGKNIKHMPVMYLEIFAGLILILLGIKALI